MCVLIRESMFSLCGALVLCESTHAWATFSSAITLTRNAEGEDSSLSAQQSLSQKRSGGEQWLGIRCRWSPEEGGGVRSLSLTNGVEETAPRQTERPHSQRPNTKTTTARTLTGHGLTQAQVSRTHLSYSVTHSVIHSNIRTAWLCDVCNVVHAQNVTRVVASTCAVDVFSSFVVPSLSASQDDGPNLSASFFSVLFIAYS